MRPRGKVTRPRRRRFGKHDKTEPIRIARRSVPRPGVQFLLALHDSAGVVTGTGSWASEAGPSGSLVPRGTAIADSIHLQVIYVPSPAFTTLKPDTAQLEAVLTTHDRIDGTLRRGSLPPSTIQLVRVRAGDPGGS